MKKVILAVLLCGLVLTQAPSALARELVIGLSPYMDKPASKLQIKSVIGFLIKELAPGDTARLYDAYHLSSLGRFAVPDKAAYRHPKAKLMVNKKVVKTLLQFAEDSVLPGGENMPTVLGTIRLPAFLRFLGQNLSFGEETDVIILGSPLFADPDQKEFSMAKGHVPGDGHLLVSLGQSPFGMTGQADLLGNLRVHLAHLNRSLKPGGNQEFFVKRFWTLFLERQGGRLITFTSDLPTLFQRVKNKAPALNHDYVLTKTKKLEMILYRQGSVKKRESIYDRPLSSIPVSRASLQEAQRVEVSITWDCKACDLDLYARPHTRARVLYFRQPESREGRYIKDFRGSPKPSNSYETIAFHKPVDLNQLALAVNFFGGAVREQVHGEFRIAVGSKVFSKKFQIKASTGNRGACVKETLNARRSTAPECIFLDPMKVISQTR